MRIGLVLGGGFSRGSAQLGFVKGLLSVFKKEDIKIISSSSIGGLNALAISSNQIVDLEMIYRQIDFSSVKNIKKALKNHLEKQIITELTQNVNKIQIPFFVTGTNMLTLTTHYFYLDQTSKYEDIYQAIDITLTFPLINGVFRRVNKRIYIDGGALDNVPTYPLKDYMNELDLILVLHCTPNYEPPTDLVESDLPLLDLVVSSRCPKHVSSFSLTNDCMNMMMDYGEKFGIEIASRLITTKNRQELKEMCRKIIHEECEIKREKKNSDGMSIVEFLNRIQQSREVK